MSGAAQLAAVSRRRSGGSDLGSKKLKLADPSDGLGQFAEQARRELEAREFLVFPSGISLEGPMALWPVDKPIGAFLDLAKDLGCRVAYFRTEVLDPDDLIDAVAVQLSEVDDAVDAPTPEEFLEQLGLASNAVVQSYLRFGTEHYGQVTSVRVEWIHAGVVHRFWKHADWHGSLIDKATEVADLIEEGDDRWRGDG